MSAFTLPLFLAALLAAPLVLVAADAPAARVVTDPLPVAPGLNADFLDGHDTSFFLPTDGKAADAELLDGLDSDQLLRSDQAGVLAGDLTVQGRLTADGALSFSGQKVCAAYRRTYYDTDYTFILVPSTWSSGTCAAWARDVAYAQAWGVVAFGLGCLFADSFSMNQDRAAPTPNCGW